MDNKVKVVHKIEDDAELKETVNPSFLITNKIGGFLSFGSLRNITRYQGSYFLKQTSDVNWKMFKVIEDIKIDKTPTHLINNFYNIERWYGADKNKQVIHSTNEITKEEFYMHKSNAFVYTLENYDGYVELILDCREIYDFDDKGRIYKIYKKPDFTIIEYTKYNDYDSSNSRDANSSNLKNENYKVYLVIKGCFEFETLDKWTPVKYEYDAKRGTKPEKLYVYKAIKIPVKNKISLIFSYSDDLSEAKETAYDMDMNYRKYCSDDDEYLKTICKMPYDTKIYDEDLKLAYKNCIKSLNDLHVEFDGNYGLFAGLPWFYHFWSRDETISTIGLMNEEQFLESKKILFKQLDNLNQNGRLPNRIPSSDLDSADSVGWCFKRINDLMEYTIKKLMFRQYFSVNDLEYVKDKLRESIVRHLKYFTYNGLAYNRKLETWMDTEYMNGKKNISETESTNDKEKIGKTESINNREGFRIEIQALRLNMYKMMKELCNTTGDRKRYDEYKKLENETKMIVRERFWRPPVLADGITNIADNNRNNRDETIRPNIFIAYYIYPELLSPEEWEACFDNALKKLWLDWGGISTIDINNKLFCDEYTGENNKSYHRGDSWFWINCLSAICMHRLEKQLKNKNNYNKNIDGNPKKGSQNPNGKKYEEHIHKIINACCEDILFKGFIGHASELSSAKELRAEGCLCQAWSAAMFIEMINEVYYSKIKFDTF